MINAQVPSEKAVHIILDNYAVHKHPKVRAWLDRHKRFVAETNKTPKPFTWTADPDKIIAAVKRGYKALDSNH